MKKRQVCPRFKPMEQLDGSPVSSGCSQCAFFSSKNCHKSSLDFLEPEDDMY